MRVDSGAAAFIDSPSGVLYHPRVRCLVFWKNGHIRKVPLSKALVTIGRSPENDIVLNDRAVSRRHCRIEVSAEHITIRDQASRNSVFIGDRPVEEARINLNGSFRIGRTEFFYKKGDLKEFRLSSELSDVTTTYSKPKTTEDHTESETSDDDTRFGTLIHFLAKKAILSSSATDFFNVVRENLPGMITSGSLFFLDADVVHLLVDHLGFSDTAALLRAREDCGEGVLWGETRLACLVVESANAPRHHTLVYLAPSERQVRSGILEQFLGKLIEILDFELELTSDMQVGLEPAPYVFDEKGTAIVGSSTSMIRAAEIARKIAPRESFVLVMGESGTGKELFARMIHRLSGRRSYVAINCAAIPPNLLESELFGFETGAFTDAKKRKIGKVEESSGGTLVLDEIGDMPLEIQAKLLRVIQEKAVVRLGANETIPVDLRIIALTNQDLYKLVEQGRFRQDLFYRLRVHEIRIPPLRERREDIAPLVRHFSRIHAQRIGVSPGGFSESVMDCFGAYAWPGNIRELDNEIRRIIEIIDNGEVIGDHHILDGIASTCRGSQAGSATAGEPPSLKEKLESSEREELRRLLRLNNGNKVKTAQAIKMSYRGLLKKLKRLGID